MTASASTQVEATSAGQRLSSQATATLLDVALLGVLSPTVLHRFPVSAPIPAPPGGAREAGVRNPPPDCSTLSADQLSMC